MMKKYLFCDLDNTLLFPLKNGEYGIKENDLNAIIKAINNDVEIVINSGRPAVIKEIISKKLGHEIDALGFNGSQLIAKDYELILASIHTKDYLKITNDIMEKFSSVNCATIDFNGTYYINDPSQSQPRDRFFFHHKVGIVKEVCTIPAGKVLVENKINEVAKILFYIKDIKYTKQLIPYLETKYGENYDFILSSDLFLEAQCKGISKSTIMDVYCNLFHINENQCYTIGDADNDIQMLKRFSGRSFCMSHGSESAKKAASIIVPNIEEALRRICS